MIDAYQQAGAGLADCFGKSQRSQLVATNNRNDLEVPKMQDQPNTQQVQPTTTKLSHTFMPVVFIETDDDGSNPRIVDVDWGDSYNNSVTLPEQRIVNDEYTDKYPPALAASEWLDQRTARLTALIVEAGS